MNCERLQAFRDGAIAGVIIFTVTRHQAPHGADAPARARRSPEFAFERRVAR